MDSREIQRLLGFVDNNDKFIIIKFKPLIKELLRHGINDLECFNKEEKIEYLELQKIVINEIILELESE